MILVVLMLVGRAGRRRHMGVVAVNVGAERGRNNAGGKGLFGETIGEMAAVTDVDLQAAIERRLNHGMHFTLAVDEASGMARERMRQHVALSQQRDHALQDRIDVFAVGAAFRQAPELTEVHIDRQVCAASDLGRHFDDANAPAREATDLRMGLDAANDVEVQTWPPLPWRRYRRRPGCRDLG